MSNTVLADIIPSDIQQLETQLRSLEQVVHQLHSVQGQGDLASAGGLGVSPFGGDTYGNSQTIDGIAQSSPASTASPLKPLASIPLSVLNESTHDSFTGSFSSVKLLSLLANTGNASPIFSSGPTRQECSKGESHYVITRLISVVNHGLSSSHLDNYFHAFHLNYPLLDQAEVRRNWDHLLSFTHEVEVEGQNEELYSSLGFLIVYMVIAISLLLEHRPDSKNLANQIYSGTIQLLSAPSSVLLNTRLLRHAGDETYIVQFIFLLALYRLLDPSGGSAWQLARYAMDTSVMFGFHRLSRNTHGFSHSNDDFLSRGLIARKEVTLWSCFCLLRSVAEFSLLILSLQKQAYQAVYRDLSALLDRSCGVQPGDIDPLPSPYSRAPSYIHAFMRHMVEYHQIQAHLSRKRSEDAFQYIAVLRRWRAATPSSLDLDRASGATPGRSLSQLTEPELSQHWDSWYYRGILECIDVHTQHHHAAASLAVKGCLFFLGLTAEISMKKSGVRWDTAIFYFSVGVILANLSAKQVVAGARKDLAEIVTALSRCSDILSVYLADLPILAPYSRLWYQFSSEIAVLLNTRLVRTEIYGATLLRTN
ncbi:unnamed protein product [Clonostachys rhizophaga]|uniref:Transcription factor domain-containing protein n=1 Tax=Clonostachys rhizophaga TaxID=160324 RepID=A0A9N9VRL8_9HYPO|nr:unnamed protein product [Clonostachys rhizophaga]